jgi:hypothetical protein
VSTPAPASSAPVVHAPVTKARPHPSVGTTFDSSG